LSYIGRTPILGNFVKLDAITTSATATYNLLNGGVAYFPQTANNCLVSLNGVIQSPTSAYTISGSTIVFSDALTSSDTIDFILVLGDVLNIGTPSDGTVGFAKVTSNLITGATAETSIAGGDSVLIYDDSASALRKMTRTNFVSGIGGANTPAFEATLSANQSISQNTYTKLQLDSESFDTDGCYDNTTNYRFTPTTAGKYFCYGTFYLLASGGDDTLIQCRILKNGNTTNGAIEPTMRVKTDDTLTMQAHSIVTLNGSTDYVEFWVYQNEYNAGGSFNARGNSSGRQFCNFGAFKLLGV